LKSRRGGVFETFQDDIREAIMKWRSGRRSQNVEDRRDEQPRIGMRVPGGLGFPGGGMRFPGGSRGVRRAGAGGIGIVILLLVFFFFGGDPGTILQNSPSSSVQGPSYSGSPGALRSATEDDLRDFVSVVLADTEDTWTDLFRRMNLNYQDPTLVLFSGAVDSACGFAQRAMGPFYCPRDGKVYIDLSFYDDLRDRFRAPGDFAQAYVIAHEVGHHVQNLLGILPKVDAARARTGKGGANALSVRLELQADCFAGVWAHQAQKQRQILEEGDIEEGLQAASAIGDDRLQRQSQGYVIPDSFTHGSSAQRVRWFRRGLANGDPQACNTFAARDL
jgi:predicted metalloprotease